MGRFMEVVTDEQLEAAEARGKALTETEPRAKAVRYNRETGRVTVDLVNGCSYIFPADMAEELSGAGHDDLAQVEVDGVGFNLHWPGLDVDLYVPALVAGVFGTRAWMNKALARQAGQATSGAKAEAARANGRKGGRPKKVKAHSDLR